MTVAESDICGKSDNIRFNLKSENNKVVSFYIKNKGDSIDDSMHVIYNEDKLKV